MARTSKQLVLDTAVKWFLPYLSSYSKSLPLGLRNLFKHAQLQYHLSGRGRRYGLNWCSTMLTKAPCHWYSTCRVMIHVFFDVFFASNFHFACLYCKVAAKNSTCDSSAVAAVTEMASSMARKELRVVDFDTDGAAEAVSLHLLQPCNRGKQSGNYWQRKHQRIHGS